MSLNIKCNCCGKILDKPGALVFSPPDTENVQKYHVCCSCWDDIISVYFKPKQTEVKKDDSNRNEYRGII